MKNIKYLLAGVFFGFVLTKCEAISWYRIQEMFRFESFHMFGIFATAVPVGIISLLILKKVQPKSHSGEPISATTKTFDKGTVLGSIIFGFGWSLTGACPGPLYAQIGAGYAITVVTFIAAVAGTWCYGKFQSRLPH